MRQLFIFLIFISLFPVSVYGERGEAGEAARYLRMGVGARALGMGGAFVSVCNDASSTYWNPAGLTQLTQREITSMTSLMSLDRIYNFLNYVTPYQGNIFGISWINFGVKDIREFVVEGGEDKELGKFDDAENTIMISAARKINDKLAVGGNLKCLFQEMNPTRGKKSGKGFGIDVGALYQISDKSNIGLMLQDINSYLKWDTGHKDTLPLTIKLGVSHRFLGDKLTIATDLEKVEGNRKIKIYAGAEYWLKENLGLRTGIFDRDVTAGLSFIFPTKTFKFRLDYSFAPDRFSDFKEDISSSERYNHRFSLSVRF